MAYNMSEQSRISKHDDEKRLCFFAVVVVFHLLLSVSHHFNAN